MSSKINSEVPSTFSSRSRVYNPTRYARARWLEEALRADASDEVTISPDWIVMGCETHEGIVSVAVECASCRGAVGYRIGVTELQPCQARACVRKRLGIGARHFAAPTPAQTPTAIAAAFEDTDVATEQAFGAPPVPAPVVTLRDGRMLTLPL